MSPLALIAAIILGIGAIAGVVIVVYVTGSTAGVMATARAIGALLVAVIRALNDDNA
jgi:hypothetical protein